MLHFRISSSFFKIYVSIFGALTLLNIFLPPVTGISFWKSLFLLSLVCIPISILVSFFLNRFSTTVTNGLYGLGKKKI